MSQIEIRRRRYWEEEEKSVSVFLVCDPRYSLTIVPAVYVSSISHPSVSVSILIWTGLLYLTHV